MVWQLCTGNGTPGWGSIQIASMGLYLLTVWVLGVQLLLLLDPQFFCLLCLSELTCHQSRFKDWERVICVTSKHWYHWDGSTIYLPPHEKCNQYKQPPQHCRSTWPSPQTSPSVLFPMELSFYLCFGNWGLWLPCSFALLRAHTLTSPSTNLELGAYREWGKRVEAKVLVLGNDLSYFRDIIY